MELTSKKEGNYNVMIKGSADHGLYVTYQLHPFVSKSYMPQPHLPHHHYELFFYGRRIVVTISSLLYQLGHQSTLALFRAEVLRVVDYLQTNAFPIGGGRAKGIPSRSTKESH